MTASRARPEDGDGLATRLLKMPSNDLVAWIVEPAPDQVAARRTLIEHSLVDALEFGAVFADHGSIVGGYALPPGKEFLRAVHLRSGMRAERIELGRLTYPPVPMPCIRRLHELALVMDRLLPSFVTCFRVTVLGERKAGAALETLRALKLAVAPSPLWCTGMLDVGSLTTLGFDLVSEESPPAADRPSVGVYRLASA